MCTQKKNQSFQSRIKTGQRFDPIVNVKHWEQKNRGEKLVFQVNGTRGSHFTLPQTNCRPSLQSLRKISMDSVFDQIKQRLELRKHELNGEPIQYPNTCGEILRRIHGKVDTPNPNQKEHIESNHNEDKLKKQGGRTFSTQASQRERG